MEWDTQLCEADGRGIEKAAKLLQQGEVVGLPTETVYGLAANAYSDAAVAKIFKAKGRPQDNPLIVHIASLQRLSGVARDIPPAAYSLAEAFWPGPLTMILPKGEKIAPSVSAGLDTVAVRMPSHPVAKRVIEACGLPLAAPSANLSGAPSPTQAAYVLADMKG
ncbi:MAG: L-threonylcarbamoyladenylate synthase, partial [Oscillospiraceae bacterium]|nr:L-threonylcarbamoyladenylate synthase [Oscillospiraceae bacterium]